MTLEPRMGPHGRDDDLTRALRRIYAAPADEAYWSALERRIMARIVEEEWWLPLAAWVRVGVVAAGVALAVASLTLVRNHRAEAQIAYRTVIETPRTAPLQMATETESGTASEREAMLRFVISP
jgi:hypothetical protein